MKLISYICNVNQTGNNTPVRDILLTDIFIDFYSQLKPKVQEKIGYGIDIIMWLHQEIHQ